MKKETLHYAHPTGLALGLTAGLIYTLCAAFIAVAPTTALRFFSGWLHGIDLAKVFMPTLITLGGFFKGLLEVIIFFYIAGVIYGWLYNKCAAHCKRHGWI